MAAHLSRGEKHSPFLQGGEIGNTLYVRQHPPCAVRDKIVFAVKLVTHRKRSRFPVLGTNARQRDLMSDLFCCPYVFISLHSRGALSGCGRLCLSVAQIWGVMCR